MSRKVIKMRLPNRAKVAQFRGENHQKRLKNRDLGQNGIVIWWKKLEKREKTLKTRNQGGDPCFDGFHWKVTFWVKFIRSFGVILVAFFLDGFWPKTIQIWKGGAKSSFGRHFLTLFGGPFLSLFWRDFLCFYKQKWQGFWTLLHTNLSLFFYNFINFYVFLYFMLWFYIVTIDFYVFILFINNFYINTIEFLVYSYKNKFYKKISKAKNVYRLFL